MAVNGSKVRTAIVLQGGGALGAYEFGVLKALYETRPGFRPAVVSGTSIGAITAAVLAGARGDPMAALERLWNEKLPVPRVPPGTVDPTSWWPARFRRALSTLGNPGMYRFRPQWLAAPWLATSVYDTAPLRATLADLVDLETLNNGDVRVIMGAIDIATAVGTFFDTINGPLTFDEVVASGSLPPGFPPTPIGDATYWDGGLFTNTPLSEAINALEQCDGGDRSVTRELIVVELFPMTGEIPRTMADVQDRMTELQYTSRLQLDERFFDKIDAEITLFEKIEALRPGAAIRDDPAYKSMQKHRRIDSFTLVSARFPTELASASDFSPESIKARIDIGYRNAVVDGAIAVTEGGRARPRRPVAGST